MLFRVRNQVKEWLDIHRKSASEERTKEISSRIMILSRFLPEPLKVQEFLHQFSDNLLRDQSLLLGYKPFKLTQIFKTKIFAKYIAYKF